MEAKYLEELEEYKLIMHRRQEIRKSQIRTLLRREMTDLRRPRICALRRAMRSREERDKAEK